MTSENSKFKSIILAAGQGTRLTPLTNNRPKCMIELFGKSLLQHQINTFHKCGISDISIVVGYLGEMINIPNLKSFKNPDFQNTNMLETLFCATPKLTDSVIVSYGDIIFEEKILNALINSEDDISIIVDKNWKQYWSLRFENPLDDAESLMIDDEKYIQEIGQKTNDLENIQAQYIGLMKFSGKGLSKIKTMYAKFKEMSKIGSNPLNSDLPFEKSYLTDFLQALIKQGCKLKAVPINGGWLELDSISDYELYKKMHKNHELHKLISIS
jgi:L-glutamine-phosphate cytidylyltransferase